MPMRICFTVMAAAHPPGLSFKMLRQTAPDGNMFGWKMGGVNLAIGGFIGYSLVNSSTSL